MGVVGDRGQVGTIMAGCCGDEWVVGEGLKDLDDYRC